MNRSGARRAQGWQRRMIGVVGLTLGALWVGASPGCRGVGLASFCDDICECEGCSDTELNQCRIDADHFTATAENYGCGDAMDALVECWESNQECEGDDWDVDHCGDAYDDVEDCMDD